MGVACAPLRTPRRRTTSSVTRIPDGWSPAAGSLVMLAPMPTRPLLALVYPEGILLVAALLLVSWASSIATASPALTLFPLAVLGAGALLGWRFQRGRLLLALAGLVVADRALLWLGPPDADATLSGPVTIRVVALLLATSLAVLAFLPERSVLSETGLHRLVVLAGETAVVLALSLLSAVYPGATTGALDVQLLPIALLDRLPLGQPVTLLVLVAVAVLVGRTLWRPDPEARGFLWAAIGSTFAAAAGPAQGRSTMYFACAGLVLVVATIESAYAMAYHDELTGLPARRALNEALERAGGTYTVAMVDVDHFKKFNDTHGHDVGDQVLRMVAGRVARVSGGGRAFRYGGEEFAVLFPGRTTEDAAPHLETLRASVARASFALRGKDRPRKRPSDAKGRGASAGSLAVTVSIGAAQARGGGTADAVVKAADRALYRAKEGGRNQVAV